MNLEKLPSTKSRTDRFKKKLVLVLGYDRAEFLLNIGPFALVACLLVSIGFAGKWITKNYYSKAPQHIDAGATIAPVINISDEGASQKLLNEYVATLGGSESWSRLVAVAYNGIIFDELGHHSFTASKSINGSMSLFVTNRGSETQIQIKDGRYIIEQTPKSEEAPGFYVRSIANLTNEFYNPLIDLAVRKQGSITNLTEDVWQNRRVYTVTIQHAAGISEMTLDTKDLALLYRVDTVDNERTESYRYTNYDEVNGLKLPTMVSVENSQGEISNIRYTDIKPQIKKSLAAISEPAALTVNVPSLQ